jgi:cyclohexa-1,5-dienecarbonyl-CoA hydratase
MSDTPARAETIRVEIASGLARITLDRPPVNVLTTAMMRDLAAALRRVAADETVRVVRLDAEGKTFSAGVDVGDHLGDLLPSMMASLGDLFVAFASVPQPVVAVVQGAALGGGLEVVLGCDLVVASEKATFGQPEIKLGVFAPAASCLLPPRIGQAAAEDLLLSGRSVDAQEALALGLVTAIADDPQAAALDWFDRHLADKSASSLALALAAVRAARAAEIRRRLRDLEALYLDRLMKTRDANEGLNAFLAKRAPKWEHA